jgi:hypothetical protein
MKAFKHTNAKSLAEAGAALAERSSAADGKTTLMLAGNPMG